MHIVFSTWGSYGDVLPYVALGQELHKQGDTCSIIAPEEYRSIVASHSIDFVSAGPRNTGAMITNGSLTTLAAAAKHVRSDFDLLARVAKDADVVVGHPTAYAVPLYAKLYGKKWASVALFPQQFVSQYDPPYWHGVQLWPLAHRAVVAGIRRATRTVLAPVFELQRELRLPEEHPLYEGSISQHLHLALFSQVLGLQQIDWPMQTVQVGACIPQSEWAPSAALKTFLDNSPLLVVVSFGSPHNRPLVSSALLQASIDAPLKLGYRVLALGAAEASTDKDVHFEQWSPHVEVFRRAACVIHHGGAGTTAAALQAKTPAVVIPLANDEFDNAQRLANAHVAVTCKARAFKGQHAVNLVQTAIDLRRSDRFWKSIGKVEDRAAANAVTALKGIR